MEKSGLTNYEQPSLNKKKKWLVGYLPSQNWGVEADDQVGAQGHSWLLVNLKLVQNTGDPGKERKGKEKKGKEQRKKKQKQRKKQRIREKKQNRNV